MFFSKQEDLEIIALLVFHSHSRPNLQAERSMPYLFDSFLSRDKVEA